MIKSSTKKALMMMALSCVSLSSIAAFAAPQALITGTVHLKTTSGEDISDASNVVIFLDNVKTPGSNITPNVRPSMSSKGKEFVPAVLPVLVGTEVDFPNEDLIFHNVFSLSKVKPFDLGLYKKGLKKTVKFDQPGVVKVYCNIHEKMAGYVVVLENPYFTLTDKNGKFEIKDAPVGDYDVIAWHRYGEQKRQPVKLAKNGKTQIDVQFEVIKGEELNFEMMIKEQSLKHKNKFGKDYKDKY